MSAQERSGWRDEWLSRRHRDVFGPNFCAVNSDAVFFEYNHRRVYAVVEYKRFPKLPEGGDLANIEALVALGERAGIPVFLVRYKPDPLCPEYEVRGLDPLADWHEAGPTWMTEEQYLEFLARVRGEVLSTLDRTMYRKLSRHAARRAEDIARRVS